MITNDQQFIKEAERIIDDYKVSSKLKLMTISGVKKKFFYKLR